MNKVILMGRLTRDPVVKPQSMDDEMLVATYTLAVEKRKNPQTGETAADFIRVVAFGNNASFAQKYLRKGTKILIEGKISTGSYQDTDGKTIYTTDVIANAHHFCERAAANNNGAAIDPNTAAEGFMEIPEGADEEMPFA